MTAMLLIEHHLEFLSLKGDCTYSCQNATLLEISFHGSIIVLYLLALGGMVTICFVVTEAFVGRG